MCVFGGWGGVCGSTKYYVIVLLLSCQCVCADEMWNESRDLELVIAVGASFGSVWLQL